VQITKAKAFAPRGWKMRPLPALMIGKDHLRDQEACGEQLSSGDRRYVTVVAMPVEIRVTMMRMKRRFATARDQALRQIRGTNRAES
jgi:hypothetical protein